MKHTGQIISELKETFEMKRRLFTNENLSKQNALSLSARLRFDWSDVLFFE